jgi:cystathionine beta-lyase/cystathionine gamma-synthase
LPHSHDIATVAIHGGRSLDTHASSLIFPLYQTGTFVHDAVGVDKGFSYSRVSNPTVDALEKAIGALEGTPPAVCFRTGLAAEATLFFSLLKPGDHVVLGEVLYGGTIRLFREILEPFGVQASFVDSADPSNVERAITPQTRLVFIESPGNPVLRLTDIAAITEITKRHGLLLVVDNTFLTPVLQRPLELGADISVLSTTKYIDGHNATVGGSLATHDVALAERFRLIRKTLGSIQAPFEAWLTLQGLKTLPARLRLHCENAQTIADWLESHPAVARVYYPGVATHPDYELQRSQASGAGSVLSFTAHSVEAAKAGAERAKMFQICVSFGSIHSTISLPGCMSHASVPPEIAATRELPPQLVRISVGIEDAGDLIADLDQALTGAVVVVPTAPSLAQTEAR